MSGRSAKPFGLKYGHEGSIPLSSASMRQSPNLVWHLALNQAAEMLLGVQIPPGVPLSVEVCLHRFTRAVPKYVRSHEFYIRKAQVSRVIGSKPFQPFLLRGECR